MIKWPIFDRIFLGLVFCGVSIAISHSQEMVDTLHISTMQAPLKISETGRNISIVTSKEIASLPVTSMDELLQTVAGVEIQSRGGFGVQADVTMRGATYTQVLILINGMKLNDPLTGHFNGYMPVTPAEIERIEVMRGPASAIYGADAVGGVVNIITKTFAGPKEETMVAGDLSYGDHQLVAGQMGFSYNRDRLSLSGGVSMKQSEGEYYPAKQVDSTTTLEAYRNDFNLRTIGASLAYQIKDNMSVRWHSAFDSRDFSARYFYTTSPFDKSSETVNSWWNHVQLHRTGNKNATDFNVSYKYNTDEFVFSPDFASTNNHVTQYTNFTINHLQVLNDDMMIKAGSQIDFRKIESNDRGDHRDFHSGVYVMGVYQRNGLNLTAGLRGDYDDNYGFELSPQLNVSFVFPRLVLRGAIGRSIRAADYTERYVSNNLPDLTPGRSLGNPDLVAERGWSEEVGLDYRLTGAWLWKGTVFFRQSTNLIDYVLTNETEIGSVSDVGSLQPGADYYFAQNIADVQTSGIEIETIYRHEFDDNKNVQMDFAYTYLSTKTSGSQPSVYLSSHARHLFTTKIRFHYRRLDLSMTGLYKYRDPLSAPEIDTELSKDYFVCHGRVTWNLIPEFGLYLQIQNLFDQAYQNILGAPMPGRWVMGGVQWRVSEL